MEAKNKQKISDPAIGLVKAQAFCAYQERSQQEVRDKLYELGLWKEAVEEIISTLIIDNFINEERFAKTFAGGKFRIKKWGKIKIKLALKQHHISEYCVRKGLQEIDEKDYKKTLREIASKKAKEIKLKDPIKKNYKVAQYAISRGFEPGLVWEVINRLGDY